jgi:hypothetical protein
MAFNQAQPDSLFSQSSPFALLVDAANAQSQNENEEERSQGASLSESQRSASKQAAAVENAQQQQHQQQHRLADWEFQEALQREALQREALQRRAALMGFGIHGLANGGMPPQDAEYLQQLRLEALVQQRRQETLAQLALAQESGMSQDMQALLQAQQFRQAGLMRQDLFHGGAGGAGGAGGGIPPEYLEQLGGLGGRMGAPDENALLQHYLERERQQKMAALAGVHTGAHMNGAEGTPAGPDMVGSHLAQEMEQEETSAQDSSKTTVLPCRARGMPMDHNVKVCLGNLKLLCCRLSIFFTNVSFVLRRLIL